MKNHKKRFCRFLAIGFLGGLFLMGVNPHQKGHRATIVQPDGSIEKTPVISDKRIKELRKMVKSERLLM